MWHDHLMFYANLGQREKVLIDILKKKNKKKKKKKERKKRNILDLLGAVVLVEIVLKKNSQCLSSYSPLGHMKTPRTLGTDEML